MLLENTIETNLKDIEILVGLLTDELVCYRRKILIKSSSDMERDYTFVCDGYGNGYGIGHTCKEDCPLRIDDLNDIIKVIGEDSLVFYDDLESLKYSGFFGQRKYLDCNKYRKYIDLDEAMKIFNTREYNK